MGFDKIPPGRPNPWQDSSLRPRYETKDQDYLWELRGVLSKLENLQHIAGLSSAPQIHQATTRPFPLHEINKRLPVPTFDDTFKPETIEFVALDWEAHRKITRWVREKGFECGLPFYLVEYNNKTVSTWTACAWHKKKRIPLSQEMLAELLAELESEIAASSDPSQ